MFDFRLRPNKKPIIHRSFALLAFVALPAAAQTLTAEEAQRLAMERPENRALVETPLEAAEGELCSPDTHPTEPARHRGGGHVQHVAVN